MSFEDIKKLIKEGKVSSALSEIKELNDDQSSLKLFSEVYNLTTWHPQKIPSSATAVDDLFELTSILCRRIMCGGKFDVAKLGKALHFVVQFFIGSCINTWLRVFSSLRYSQGMDNQVVLLVFTSVHPRFMDQAMEAWASMKLSKSKLLAMDATVADVFEAYRDDMVKRYPDFKPDNLDFNQLLLSEVRAYCKWRDQLNKPIIAVYKKAAKMVKNHVYLANILCCTIDALCLSTDGNVYLPSLEKSLVNITAHLRKLEEEELEKQNHGDNSKMVILQENAKDDLDMTEVAFMTSPVKLSKQPEIFKFLELAVKYWTDAESLVDESRKALQRLDSLGCLPFLVKMQYRTLTALMDMTDPDVGQLSADGQPPYASLLKNVENLLYVIKVGTYESILHVKSQIESVTPENKKSTKTSIIDNAPAKPAIEMGDRKYLDRKKTRSTQPLAFGESSNQSSNLNVPDKAPSIVITPPPAGNPAKMHSTAGRLGRKAVLFSSPDKENDSKSGNAFLGTPGIAQLGNSATPAIKVFYDPEGLESKSTARRKPKSTRDLKLSTTGKRTKLPRTAALEKIGTPLPSKASRTRKLFSTIDPSDWDADLAVGNGTPKSAKGAGKSSDIESGNRLEKNEDDAPSGQPTPGSSGDKIPGNDVPAPLDNFNGVASLEEELETELQPHVSNKSMNETAIGVTPTALKKVKARRHIIDSSMESIDENAHQPNPGSRHGPAVAGLNASEKSRIPKVNMGPPDSADVKKSNHLTLPKGRRKLDLRKASPSSSSAKPLTSRFLEIEDSSADETIIGVSPSMLQKVRARRNLLNGTIVPADPSFLEDSSIDSISSAGNSGYPDENVPTGSDCIGKSSVEKTRPIGLLKAPVPLSDKESPGGRIENIKGRSKMLDSTAEKKASPSSPKKVRARRNILGGSRYHENASSGSNSQAKPKVNDVLSSKVNTGQSRLSKVAKPCPKKADTFSKSEKNSTSSSDFILIGVTPRSLEKVRDRRSPLEESFDTREKSCPSEASRCKTGVAYTPLLKAKPAAGNAGNADPSLADQAGSSKPSEIKPPKTLDEQLASEMWKLEIQKTPITRNAKSRVERAEQPNSAAEVGAIGVPPSANRVPSADPCSSDSEADVSGIVGPSPPDISQNRTRSLQLTPAKGILQQLSSLSLKTPSSKNPDSRTDSTASKTGIASKTVRTRKK
ncbi:unnamed protein product [Nesidiocoris tenuis]|uniref:Uncharacterized protein n=1 Tax=Nesidiocoris tenuis TaxID=355587 RepID=A0A6H5GK16_9HEMI|nr:unnamed protein product [Nesidiocoris tenuis]